MKHTSPFTKYILLSAVIVIMIGCTLVVLSNLRSYIQTKKIIVDLPREEINQTYSLEEQVGQRFVWGITGPTLSSESAKLITDTHAAGVIIMGDLHASEINALTSQINTLPHRFPFIIAIDQEGGSVKRLVDDENPGGNALGNMDSDMFCSVIQQTSSLLYQIGVNTNFGIIGDIGWFTNAYIYPRTYGKNVQTVIDKVVSALSCSHPILTTVKHYPGHGKTLLNSHITIPHITTSLTEWEQNDAQSFTEAIAHNAHFIMFGHLIYDNIASEPASLSPWFHTYLINKGFNGLTITDDLGMLERSNLDPKDTLYRALDAQNDLLLYVTSNENPYTLFQDALLYATSSAIRKQLITDSFDHIVSFKSKYLHK